MNYTKPEITSLATAGSVIHGIPKYIKSTLDGLEIDRMTLDAYEADE